MERRACILEAYTYAKLEHIICMRKQVSQFPRIVPHIGLSFQNKKNDRTNNNRIKLSNH